MNVKKRNGTMEKFDLNKFHTMVEESCKGLAGVSASQVEINCKIQFYDGISTKEIQEMLIRSASDLISLENPNYQYVASRLLLFSIYKEVYNQFEHLPLIDVIKTNILNKSYDPDFLNWYTEDEISILNSYIKFDRDYSFTYAGLRQVYDKYLVQDRVSKVVYETPQIMYMMIAATLFKSYPKNKRLNYTKRYYDAISTFKISLPTPIMGGVRTPTRQYSSCVLLDVDDDLNSIFNTNTAVGKYIAGRAGIGLNFGRIRAINSKIRGGEVSHTGVIPFLKMFEATTRSCTQNGIRGGNCLKKDTDVLVVESADIDGKLCDKEHIFNNLEKFKGMSYKLNYVSKKVQDIELYDIVLSYDINENKQVINYVSELFQPIINKDDQVRVYFNKFYIDCSDKHPFFVLENNDWIEAQYLKIGETVVDSNNNKLQITKIEYTGVENEVYYDFTVNGTHCYYAGSDDKFILVHNSTTHFQIWHKEIQDIIVLKNNKGTDDNRVRKMDYSIQISKLFYERFIDDQEMTLFSPHDVPDLYEKFGYPEFDDLYVKYENDPSKNGIKISARNLLLDVMKERAETGRIYIMNIDHVNSHSPFNDKVYMSNLCQEIALPTMPIKHIDDVDGKIATCILSAINLGKISDLEDLEDLCDLAVRALEETIDHQEYPVAAAEKYTKEYRTLGIGYIGLAHYLAKNKVKYSDNEAWKLMHDTSEAFQYYLMKATMNVAKEKGPAIQFANSKLAEGILPIDTYYKKVDEIVPNILNYDWESLRKDIVKYGVRNLTVSAQMPSESCLKYDHKIKTTNGYFNFREILEQNNIDWSDLELNEFPTWVSLNTPITVETMNGNFEVNKVLYNGMSPTIKLHLENGKIIECTSQHKFLIKDKDNNIKWVHAHELNENDDILKYTNEYFRLKILKIEYNDTLVPTYDIEVPVTHSYLIEDDIVSHNSSVTSNATNGVEPPRAFMSIKKSKKGTLKQIVPGYPNLKNHYTLLWDMPNNEGYLKIMAVMQKFFDQSISANTSYNSEKYEKNEVPMSEIIKDLLLSYKYGLKNLYYHNTADGKKEFDSETENTQVKNIEIKNESDDDCESCKI